MMFNDAKVEMAYVKGSVLGFSGTGKTFSTTMIAIGLTKFLKLEKPVFFLDTETGSDYVKKYYDRAGVGFKTAKTRAFMDLLAAVDEAEKSAGVLVIDSITHFWNELMTAYLKKNDKKRLTLRDWSVIKPEWAQFTHKYLNSKLHILMCGRAGWEFDQEVNENGEKELQKVGTKMKVETDLGYEPSLSLEFERMRKTMGKAGGQFVHRCWVLKDRFNLINGKYIDFQAIEDSKIDLSENNPVFKFVLPHVQSLNLGGEHKAMDETRTSETMFGSEDHSAVEYFKRRDIAVEEVESEMTLAYPGRDNESNKAKIQLLKDAFGTASWTAIQNMKLEDIQAGKEKLKGLIIAKKTSDEAALKAKITIEETAAEVKANGSKEKVKK